MVSEAAVEAIGGAAGASIALAATYPLAITSTWQALEHSKGLEKANEELKDRYKWMPSPFRELCIYSEARGWRALFAGLKPCLVATAISQAVYFYFYSALRQAIVAHKRASEAARLHGKAPGGVAPPVVKPSASSSRSEAIGVAGSLIVAGLAGCGNVLATTPVWVVATQLQAQQRHADPAFRNRSPWQVAMELYKESGLVGFWRGVVPSLVMVTNPTLQYILYEWLMARLLQLRQSGAAAPTGKGRPRAARLGAGDVFMLTAMAKLGATLITYPMMLIKSRLQAMNKDTAKEARYSGVLHAVATILRREGLVAFYKGMRLKMFQTVLAAALLMTIKEQVYLSTKALIASAVSMASGGGPGAPVAIAVAPAAVAAVPLPVAVQETKG